MGAAGIEVGLARFERRGVLGVAALVALVELAVANRYGWHRDELYFLEAGHHLAWGYIDQPPFTPLIARLADAVAPGNLVVLRTLPALAVGATVVVAAAIAREFGATPRMQTTAAAATGAGGFLLGVGHLLSTATFDLLAWMTLLFLIARLLRTGDTRWWLLFGGVAGASMLNKNLLVLLGIAVLTGLLVERRWDLLVSGWLASGVVIAGVIAAPNLLWQYDRDWPQLDMARVLSERLATENRLALLPLQILFVGPAFVTVLWQGARVLGANETLRPFRALLWAWPAGIVAALVTGGRPYYVIPLTLIVLLAGISMLPDQNTLRVPIVLNAVFSALFALPLLPASTAAVTASVNEVVAETIGWPELVDQVADVIDGLPADEQDSVIILTASYGEAGAIDRFGPSRGLPTVYSPHNAYADFRQPASDDVTVVAVRQTCEEMRQWFEHCEQVATIDLPHDIPNEANGAAILVLHGLRGTWPEVWAQMRFLA